MEWVRLPAIIEAQNECKEETRDLSNFYKKDHLFLLTLIQSAGNSAQATVIKQSTMETPLEKVKETRELKQTPIEEKDTITPIAIE